LWGNWYGRGRCRNNQRASLVFVRDLNRNIHCDRTRLRVKHQGKANHTGQHQQRSPHQAVPGALAHGLHALRLGWRGGLLVATFSELE
jgi:hypothetical protein